MNAMSMMIGIAGATGKERNVAMQVENVKKELVVKSVTTMTRMMATAIYAIRTNANVWHWSIMMIPMILEAIMSVIIRMTKIVDVTTKEMEKSVVMQAKTVRERNVARNAGKMTIRMFVIIVMIEGGNA